MDRQTVCRAQSAMCRDRAETDSSKRAYWLSEAERWESLATQDTGHLIVTFDGSRNTGGSNPSAR